MLNKLELQILPELQLQNLKQTSASWLNLKFKILTKASFRISTKIQLHNLYKTSVAKYWPNSSLKSCLNFDFKILTKPYTQSLNKSLALWPYLSFQICNKLLPTWFTSQTSAKVTTPTSFELASSHARVTSIKWRKRVVHWQQQLVSFTCSWCAAQHPALPSQLCKFQVLVSGSGFFNLRKISIAVATSLSSWYHSQPSTPRNRSQLGS